MRKNEKVYIAACDKDSHIHDEVHRFLKEYEEEKKVSCALTRIASTAELLSFQESFDILLLELEMPEMDGMEAALRLRERGVGCKIIVLTCRADRFKDAFKIGAIRFVTKPIERGEFFEALDAARICVAGRRVIQVFRNGCSCHIWQREVVYIMANGSETKIFTKKQEYRSGTALSAWQELLDERLFFLCHRSYCVNLSKITKIEKNVAVLETGERVPVARRKRKELLQAYIEKG